MKKLSIALAALLILGACASNKPTTFPGAPKWWTKRPTDDLVLYGVGTSLRPMPNLAEQTATVRARQAIAGTLDEQIRQILDDVQEASGVGLGADAIEYNKTVGAAVRKNSLQYAAIEETAWGRDGRCYVLVSYDKDKAIKMAKKTAKEEKIKFKNLQSKLEGTKYIQDLDQRMNSLESFTNYNPKQD